MISNREVRTINVTTRVLNEAAVGPGPRTINFLACWVESNLAFKMFPAANQSVCLCFYSVRSPDLSFPGMRLLIVRLS